MLSQDTNVRSSTKIALMIKIRNRVAVGADVSNAI
jgi:hypothetical protein